jgi:hypothetical protein
MIKNKDKVNLYGQMEDLMKENGKMENNMVQESMLQEMDNLKLVFGQKERD